jgi:hypothetical protein
MRLNINVIDRCSDWTSNFTEDMNFAHEITTHGSPLLADVFVEDNILAANFHRVSSVESVNISTYV